jgi:antitoxin YefM
VYRPGKELSQRTGHCQLTERTLKRILEVEVHIMTINITKARKDLYRLINEVAETHQPVQITGKRHNAILLSEEDWISIQETLHLLSIPGMRESIRKGLKTPLSECKPEPGW